MKALEHKVDFAVVIYVNNANPNGDPLSGNRPRTNYEGYGEISDVCIKRKIRNRFMDMGLPVFVQSDDNKKDNYKSLRARAEGELGEKVITDNKALYASACEKWIDVRAFGQLFALKGEKKDGISVGIRGPVSVQAAFSLEPVTVEEIQITKSVSGEGDGQKKASDTMGMKYRIGEAVYVFKGSVNPQLAEKTGFSEEDAECLKDALLTLFENDASSARPEGSMEVYKVYWWEHNAKNGQYSSAQVHRSLQVVKKTEDAKKPEDYNFELIPLPGLVPEIYDGR